jgi:integrase
LVNRFLNWKRDLVKAGELAARTLESYKAACDEVVAAFGKRRSLADIDSEDFAALRTRLAGKWGKHRVINTIQYVRSLFKYAYEKELIDRPMRFGPEFKRPSKKVMRLERMKAGPRFFTPQEIHQLLGAAGPHLKAMLLLAVNAGFGNADCGTLPLSALDLEGGWVRYPRPKTGVERRCPLWPETVAALRVSLARRTEPKDPADADLVFITKYGGRWFKGDTNNPLSAEVRKLLDGLGINGRRNFYALRHTFLTVADAAKDPPARDCIMGHARDDMASVYREWIDDGRLRAVTDHVRAWLYPPAKVDTAAAGSV